MICDALSYVFPIQGLLAYRHHLLQLRLKTFSPYSVITFSVFFSLKNFFLGGTFCNYILRASDPTLVDVLYLIVAFWNASAAYQASLVEPGMVRIPGETQIPTARSNEPDMPPKRTKKVWLGICRTKIQPTISVTVIKSARRYTEWPARRIIRVHKCCQTHLCPRLNASIV